MQAQRQLLAKKQRRVKCRRRTRGQTVHLSRARLLDIIDRCLDKGIVVQTSGCVRLLGIEALSCEVETVVTSLEKYLEYAAAMERTAHVVEAGEADGAHEQVPPQP
jgi:hypothetical protein